MDLKDRQRKDQGTCWMMGCKDGGGGGYRVGVGAGPRSLVWGSAVLFSPCLACGPWVCVCACGTLKGHYSLSQCFPLCGLSSYAPKSSDSQKKLSGIC